MLMTEALWKLRLENEYRAMTAFPFNTLFSWKLSPGQQAPCAKSYLVTYHVKTELPSGAFQESTTVEITLPDSPGSGPRARITAGKIPFHPNVYSDGNICIGNLWDREPILWKLVINIGKMLAFDPEVTNPNSPANSSAVPHWQANRWRYPCGRIDFPHPKGY